MALALRETLHLLSSTVNDERLRKDPTAKDIGQRVSAVVLQKRHDGVSRLVGTMPLGGQIDWVPPAMLNLVDIATIFRTVSFATITTDGAASRIVCAHPGAASVSTSGSNSASDGKMSRTPSLSNPRAVT